MVSSVRQMSCIVAMLTSKHKVTPDLVHLWRHVYISTDAPITNLFYAILLSNSLVSRRLVTSQLAIGHLDLLSRYRPKMCKNGTINRQLE